MMMIIIIIMQVYCELSLLFQVITFNEAVKRGLINRESGAFKDTATGMYNKSTGENKTIVISL